MAEVQDDYRAHMETYTSFNKLVLFTILWIVLLLTCMARDFRRSPVDLCPCSWASAAPWPAGRLRRPGLT